MTSGTRLSNLIKNTIILSFAITFTVYCIRTIDSREEVGIRGTSAIADDQNEPKTILFWNSFFEEADYKFGFGRYPFLENKCRESNCYITNDKKLLPVQHFDAIVFHGPEFNPSLPLRDSLDIPGRRSTNQIYIYFSMESPLNRPFNKSLNGFFNTTMTYRLDSDIPVMYYAILDISNNYIAPMNDPKWIKPVFRSKLSNSSHKKKSKAVAWFASNCNSKNERSERVRNLQDYIQVDIYGRCGPLSCPRSDDQTCLIKLQDDYFFYLSFENSNCDDYVTEKVSKALLNNVIPVIYNGANLTKFLPPYSYIDASTMYNDELADRLTFLINSPKEYNKYFWWKEYYKVTYLNNHFCDLCEKLHINSLPRQQYDIYKWWHGTKDAPRCH